MSLFFLLIFLDTTLETHRALNPTSWGDEERKRSHNSTPRPLGGIGVAPPSAPPAPRSAPCSARDLQHALLRACVRRAGKSAQRRGRQGTKKTPDLTPPKKWRPTKKERPWARARLAWSTGRCTRRCACGLSGAGEREGRKAIASISPSDPPPHINTLDWPRRRHQKGARRRRQGGRVRDRAA